MATGPGEALRSFLDGPEPPRVRPEALARTYTVRRDRGNRVVLVRAAPEGEEVELASSARPAGIAWRPIAGALLADALEGRPPRRLVSDYARFIVVPRSGTRAIAGAELQEWLSTWRPSILAILSSGR
jgi:hypothetical protein